MAKPELRKEWERRISIFKQSGQTQTKWCATNDINIHQLKYWLKRIEDPSSTQKPSTKWVSVVVEEQPKEIDDILQIKIGHVTIDVKQGFNPSLLADVVKTLKTV
jgi:tRNA(Met) C34 N-acetyltransferase TmcA